MSNENPAMEKLAKDIATWFTYHPPTGDQPQRYNRIREGYRKLAELIRVTCGPSRETSICLTLLQQSCQMANAAVAINRVGGDSTEEAVAAAFRQIEQDKATGDPGAPGLSG